MKFNWLGPRSHHDHGYPIVAAPLAAPHVKAVRTQTMPRNSYVFVGFEDGAGIYGARSRVLEYLQTIAARLPEGCIPELCFSRSKMARHAVRER